MAPKRNAYFQALLTAKAAGAAHFEYRGTTYTRGVTRSGMVVYRSFANFFANNHNGWDQRSQQAEGQIFSPIIRYWHSRHGRLKSFQVNISSWGSLMRGVQSELELDNSIRTAHFYNSKSMRSRSHDEGELYFKSNLEYTTHIQNTETLAVFKRDIEDTWELQYDSKRPTTDMFFTAYRYRKVQ